VLAGALKDVLKNAQIQMETALLTSVATGERVSYSASYFDARATVAEQNQTA
jgi:hypothetical protein